jgi:hypothetical protein
LPWTDTGDCFSSTSSDEVREAVSAWLQDATVSRVTPDYAMSALTWCRRLPILAEVLPARVWWDLFNHLLETAAGASAASVNDRSEDAAMSWQLLAGELALTLAYLFPEMTTCRRLLPRARLALTAGLADLLDGKGLLHAKAFDWFWPLLACWTRCRTLGRRLKRSCWTNDAERQYGQLVRNALRLTRRDGSLALGDRSTDDSNVKMLLAAVKLCGDKTTCELAARAIDGSAKKIASRNRGLPKAGVHSEWAAAAVLRPNWSRSAPRLVVLSPGDACRVELGCGRDILWSGEWSMDVRIDGVKAAATSEWTELCWMSDKDVDYLELEMDLGPGLRVQRHFVLARQDRILLMADAVLASKPAALEYRGTLPLQPDISFRDACGSCRGVLAGSKPRAMVLPLALPERREENAGEPTTAQNAMVADSHGLQLRQATVGQSLFAPLFFDLEPRRFLRATGGLSPSRERLVWRQLTVGELWAVQPPDVAVGYRVAVGRQQWLIYRSLARPGNRTLLGHNISSEMLVARFDRKGEVESLIEIEA